MREAANWSTENEIWRAVARYTKRQMQLWSLCGAVAVLMSGWYLMLPPLRMEGPASDPNSNIVVDAKAPLSKWAMIAEFQTEKECQEYPSSLRGLLLKRATTRIEKSGSEHMMDHWFPFAECVQNDDPQLARRKPWQ